MGDKVELKFFTSSLNTDFDYTIDELKEECEKALKMYKNDPSHIANAKKGNYTFLDKYTIRAYTEYGYYGDSNYSNFEVQFYRTESDAEYQKRLKTELLLKRKEAEAEAKLREKERIKEEQRKKREADPDYKKYLQLQKKFRNAKKN